VNRTVVDSWEQFINGPLSPAGGGCERLVATAQTSFYPDVFDDDDLQASNVPSTFVLRAGESTPQLFDYQEEIIRRLLTWYEGTPENSNRSVMVSLPTGGGKTRTAICLIQQLLKARPGLVGSVVWVAPTIELVHQAIETLKDIWNRLPGSSTVKVYVNELPKALELRRTTIPSIVFLTTQLAAKRLPALRRLESPLLIFDEAHQAVARTFAAIVRDEVAAGGRVIGLTATPGRILEPEGRDLAELFTGPLLTSSILGAHPVRTLRERGVLSQVVFSQIQLPDAWSSLRITSTTGRSLSNQQLAVNKHRFWATVEAIAAIPTGHKTLVFGASVAHCKALELALRDRGVSCGSVFHTHSEGARRKMVDDFATGNIAVLLNKSILSTGYDCKSITDVVLATPVRSAVMWEQIVGRVSRGPAVGGTEEGVVWEIDDHRRMHGDLLSYARFLGELWA
jgi:DNA repair protein RadD